MIFTHPHSNIKAFALTLTYTHTNTLTNIVIRLCSSRRSSKCWYYVNVLVFCLFVCLFKISHSFLEKAFSASFHLYPWIAIDFRFQFDDLFGPKFNCFTFLSIDTFFLKPFVLICKIPQDSHQHQCFLFPVKKSFLKSQLFSLYFFLFLNST